MAIFRKIWSAAVLVVCVVIVSIWGEAAFDGLEIDE